MRPAARTALVGWLLALAACAGSRDAAAPSTEPAIRTMVADRLVFGRAIPEGGSVSEEDWRAFLEEVVTPKFPEGLTVWRAEGQWTDPGGVLVGEPVLVIEIVHPASARADSAMASIAEEYRRRFRQDAVLRVTTEARVHLFE
ncbi:MAG: DUF3574 domain-containing protein [Actinobacteria bacterium]|nr:DUF3574 domain-containing protein [Actinomycetota bacterium]